MMEDRKAERGGRELEELPASPVPRAECYTFGMYGPYGSRLIDKREVARGTFEFRFEKPDAFSYQAGQSVDLALVASADGVSGMSRTFSLASAPHEPELRIATRMGESAFKRSLSVLEEGSEVHIEGPFGSFVLPEGLPRSVILIAGGIGVTPLRSIVADAHARSLPHRVHLFYANRTLDDAAYITELNQLTHVHAAFSLIPTMTRASDWQGERGYITAEMIGLYEPLYRDALYYISGPVSGVFAIRKMLHHAGVPIENVRFEEFAGYALEE